MNSHFKFTSNSIWSPLQMITVNNFHLKCVRISELMVPILRQQKLKIFLKFNMAVITGDNMQVTSKNKYGRHYR